jgi:hypothetical protein
MKSRAEKGYDGGSFLENLLMRDTLPIIQPRLTRKTPAPPPIMAVTKTATESSASTSVMTDARAPHLLVPHWRSIIFWIR